MQKEWNKSKVDLYFEDLENEVDVRCSFQHVVETPTDAQITAFTQAVDSLSDLTSTYTVLVQEFKYEN